MASSSVSICGRSAGGGISARAFPSVKVPRQAHDTRQANISSPSRSRIAAARKATLAPQAKVRIRRLRASAWPSRPEPARRSGRTAQVDDTFRDKRSLDIGERRIVGNSLEMQTKHAEVERRWHV